MDFEEIKRVIIKHQSGEEPLDWVRYWRSRTVEERFMAIEFLRQQHFGYDPATARMEKVLKVVDCTYGH